MASTGVISIKRLPLLQTDDQDDREAQRLQMDVIRVGLFYFLQILKFLV